MLLSGHLKFTNLFGWRCTADALNVIALATAAGADAVLEIEQTPGIRHRVDNRMVGNVRREQLAVIASYLEAQLLCYTRFTTKVLLDLLTGNVQE